MKQMVCEMCPFMEMDTGGAAQLAPDVVVRARIEARL